MVSNTPTLPQANAGQTLIAATPRDLLAMTTTIIRGKNLLADGYLVEEAKTGRGFFTVTGEDEVGPRSGKVTPHGPYRVDAIGQTCSCSGFQHRYVCKHLECATAVFYGVVMTPFCEVLEDQLYALATPGGSQYLVGAESLIYVFRSRDLASHRAKSAAKTFGPLQATPLDSAAIQAAIDDPRYGGVRLTMDGDFSTILFPATTSKEQVTEANRSERCTEDAWATWKEDTAHALIGLGNGKEAEVRSHSFPKYGTPEWHAQVGKDFR